MLPGAQPGQDQTLDIKRVQNQPQTRSPHPQEKPQKVKDTLQRLTRTSKGVVGN